MSNKPKIYVIDDNEQVTESLQWLLESVNYQVATYNRATDFLTDYQADQHSCLVVDVRMPEITGLELQELLLQKGIAIPMIFITAYADVATAVRAMKLGAVDFLIKPVNNQTLLEAINKALKLDSERRLKHAHSSKANTLIEKLTPREREIMLMMASGELNKNIASKLGISQKTVELHRSNVMRKLGVKTIAELVRLVLTSDIL